MALQIWCPFTTDFRNLGIIGELNKSGSPSITSDGKLGNCITNSNGYFTFPQTAFPASTGFTCCAWVYITNLNKTNGLVSNTESGPVYSGCLISNGKLDYRHYNNGWLNSYGNTTLSANTWYHVAFVILGTTVKFYVNGEPDGELDSTTGSNNYLNVICRSYYGSSEFTGKLNDVRIYDHCLTPQEVKEISKGLVAHYTLGSASVYEATTNIASSLTPALIGGWGGMTITKLRDNSYHLKATHTSSDSWHTFVYTLPSDCAGQTITFSTYISNIVTSNVNLTNSWLFIGKGNDGLYPTHGSATYTYAQLKNNQLLSWTGTLSNSNRYLIIECWNSGVPSGSTGFIEFDLHNIQIEKKDHITHYVDGTRSPGLIYDSSGFGRNLIITGNILPSDSVRYNSAVYLPNQNANANYLSADGWSPQNFLTTGSISFWCKFNGLGSCGWLPFTGQDSGHYVMASNNGGSFYHDQVGSATKIIYRDGVVVTAPSDNENWHHYVITGIDLSNWTDFYINQYGNCWDSNMYISDVRIYNTVLTLLDVKDLYSLGATLS